MAAGSDSFIFIEGHYGSATQINPILLENLDTFLEREANQVSQGNFDALQPKLLQFFKDLDASKAGLLGVQNVYTDSTTGLISVVTFTESTKTLALHTFGTIVLEGQLLTNAQINRNSWHQGIVPGSAFQLKDFAIDAVNDYSTVNSVTATDFVLIGGSVAGSESTFAGLYLQSKYGTGLLGNVKVVNNGGRLVGDVALDRLQQLAGNDGLTLSDVKPGNQLNKISNKDTRILVSDDGSKLELIGNDIVRGRRVGDVFIWDDTTTQGPSYDSRGSNTNEPHAAPQQDWVPEKMSKAQNGLPIQLNSTQVEREHLENSRERYTEGIKTGLGSGSFEFLISQADIDNGTMLITVSPGDLDLASSEFSSNPRSKYLAHTVNKIVLADGQDSVELDVETGVITIFSNSQATIDKISHDFVWSEVAKNYNEIRVRESNNTPVQDSWVTFGLNSFLKFQDNTGGTITQQEDTTVQALGTPVKVYDTGATINQLVTTGTSTYQPNFITGFDASVTNAITGGIDPNTPFGNYITDALSVRSSNAMLGSLSFTKAGNVQHNLTPAQRWLYKNVVVGGNPGGLHFTITYDYESIDTGEKVSGTIPGQSATQVNNWIFTFNNANAAVISAENEYLKAIGKALNLEMKLVDDSVTNALTAPINLPKFNVGGALAGSFPTSSVGIDLTLPEGSTTPVLEFITATGNTVLDFFSTPAGSVVFLADPNVPRLNPLVLDLDGDGIETIGLNESNVYFDMTGDGFKQRTGWASGDDGQLVVDSNSDGKINDINELFGGEQLGFDVLATYDSNTDGTIDSSDTNFTDLKVWKDADEDGVTDANELKSLSDHNITSIDLDSIETLNEKLDNGNELIQRTTYTKSDSSTREISDYGFAYSSTDSFVDADYTVDLDTLHLPWLRGSGLVKDLLMTASGDDSLKQLIRDVAFERDTKVLYDKMDGLLQTWAEVDTVDPTLMRGPITERKAQLLNKFLNLDIPTTLMDDPRSGAFFESAYIQLKDKLYVDFISQTDVGTRLGLSHDYFRDDVEVDLTQIYASLIRNMTDSEMAHATYITAKVFNITQKIDLATLQSTADTMGYGHGLVDLLTGRGMLLTGDAGSDYAMLRFNGGTVVDEFGNTWSTLNSASIDSVNPWKTGEKHVDVSGVGYLSTSDVNPVSNGWTLRWRQRIDSVSGTQTLAHGNTISFGVYMLNGQTFIGASDNNSSWNIGSDTGTKTSWTVGDWYEMEFSYSSTDGYRLFVDGVLDAEITATTKMRDAGGIRFGVNSSNTDPSYGAVSDIFFTGNEVLHTSGFTPSTDPYAPGAITNIRGLDVRSDIISANSEDNSIFGESGDDQLAGNAGDDTLQGAAGSDTYVYNIGDGDDLIIDSQGVSRLAFGEGIRLDDLEFVRTINGSTYSDDLEVRVGFTGNKITIQDWFVGPEHRIHRFAFQGDQTLGTLTQSSFSYHELESLIAHEQTANATTDGSSGDDIIINQGDSTIDADTASTNMAPGDDDWRAMLRFGGTDGSTSMTDEFGNTWTAFGNAQIGSTTPWKTGEKHVTLDGTGDYIKTTAINPSTDQYTLRWRQRFDNFTGSQTLVSSVDDQSIKLVHTGTKLKLSLSSDSLTWDIGETEGTTTSWTTNQWYELELSYSARDGYRLFVDGVEEIKITDLTPVIDPQGLVFGADSAGSNASTGAIADLYFTNSEVLHTADFTPSTDPYAVGDAGTGDDQIINFGNATITGGGGDDTIISGSGDDTFVYDTGFGEDDIFDTSGSDTLNFSAFTSGLSIDVSGTSFVESAGNTVTWNSGAIENIITGTGNDTLTGDADDNKLTGGSGNDSLVGAGGDDSYAIASGFGLDTISDTAGSDALDLSAFTSGVNVDVSGTSFVESAGNTITWGVGELEEIVGGSAGDTLTGDSGSNTLTGNGGGDSLVGSTGDDTYVFGTGFGLDTISDTGGSDTMDFSTFTSNLTIDVSGTSFSESAGNTVSWGAGEVENVVSGSGDDTLTGDSDANTLAGGSGDDSLVGAGGHDTYKFQAAHGNDTISDTAGTDTLDMTSVTSDTDIDISGTSYIESANNTITWGSGEIENVSTGVGNDTLTGDSDNNTLNGGAGSDTYVFNTAFGLDTISDASGLDTLDFSVFTTALSIDVSGTSFAESVGNTVTWGTDEIDNITTGSGADSLTGNAESNILTGGTGNDTLVGGDGNDLLQGGSGDDSYNGFTNATEADVINDIGGTSDSASFSGHNTTSATWALGDSDLDGNIDQLKIDFGSGHSVTINDYFDDTTSVLGSVVAGTGAIESLVFDDDADVTLTDVKTLAAADTGTAGNDTMTGTNFDDNMDGLAGNDVIDALSGDDTVVGGTGNDQLTGGSGDDSLDGGAGDDTYVFDAGFGSDTITDASGTDKLDLSGFSSSINVDLSDTSYVNSFGNTISWSASAIENLTTGEGNDILTGNSSANELDGGAGDDQYVFATGFGLDTITDSAGSDTVDLSSFTSAVSIDLSTDSSFVESAGNTVSWTLGAIEAIAGGSGNDTLTGDSDANTLTGGAGNDSLDGGSGDDTLVGGTGDDVLEGNSDDNQLFGDAGDDTLEGGSGDDDLQGGVGDDSYVLNTGFGLDTITESAGEDTLDLSSFSASLNVDLTATSFVESAGNTVTWDANSIDNLMTGSAADTLKGNTSDNILTGGTGNDSYTGLDDQSGVDIIEDTGGTTDSATFTGVNTTDAAWGALDTDSDGNVDMLKIDFENGHSVSIKNYFDDTASSAAGSGAGTGAIESLVFDDDADVTFSEAQTHASADYGTSGNDSMDGTAGDDVMDGLAGNDTINGLGGNDEITGNSGDDTVDGGAGNDTFIEGTNTGADSYTGGAGTDSADYTAAATQVKYFTDSDQVVTGGVTDTLATVETLKASSTVANDEIYGALNSAALTVNLSTSSLSGSDGDVTTIENFDDVVGSAYNDTITGSSSDNWVNAQAGADSVLGGSGDDELLGASGADTLKGEAGNDILDGGDDNDTLEGGDDDDTLTGGLGNDTLKGGAGDDTYLGFTNASGVDVIDDSGNPSTPDDDDVLSFAGFKTTDVVVTAVDSGDADSYVDQLKIDFQNGNSVTIENYFDNTADAAGTSGKGDGFIETIIFDDNDAIDLQEARKLIYRGTSGDDDITGTDSSTAGEEDFIQGNAGNDTIDALAGDDHLEGGAGNDSLLGGSGDDILVGGTGNDTLDGGAGDDTYVFSAGDGSDEVIDTAGIDTFDFSSFTEGIDIDLSSTEFGAGGGSDTDQALLHFDGDDDSTTITDEFGNTWTSNNGADIQSDSPWLSGEKHVDLAGSQYISSTGVDTDGDAWTLRWRQRLNDVGSWRTLVAGNGNVALGIFVHNGNLKLHASSNNSGWNLGTDTGSTSISTNTWYEIEVTFSTTNGYKLYLDGTEEASLSSTTKMYDSNGLRFGMGYAGTDSSSGDVADVYFTNTEELHTSDFTPLSVPWSSDGVSWAANAIENALGGQSNDTMTGNTGANTLFGDDGDDTISGGAGDDTLLGGSGLDTLTGDAGADELDGGDGNDTYTFASGFGDDTVSDGSGSDTLDFSSFSSGLNIDLSGTSFVESAGNTVTWTAGEVDNLTSGSGNDTLTGNSGANVLDGGTGNDSLAGGAGDDTYDLQTGFGLDTISDSTGLNVLDVSFDTQNLSLDLSSATSYVESAGNTVTWTSGDIEGIYAGSGNDTLTGDTDANILAGGTGNDSLVGAGGDDTYVFISGYGLDTVNDSGGSDSLDFSNFNSNLNLDLTSTSYVESAGNTVTWTSNTVEGLVSGSGNDTLTGNASDNTLSGGSGDDTLEGAAGDDNLDGGAGDDQYVFDSGFGEDTLTDSDGFDTLDFSSFSTDLNINLSALSFAESAGNTLTWNTDVIEKIIGGSGDDAMTGNSAGNHLTGTTIQGLGGDDTLVGGSGDDELDGGTGNDSMTGGAGNDSYIIGDGFGEDTISDASGFDTLDFSQYTSTLNIDIGGTSFVDATGNTLTWGSGEIENLIGALTGDNNLIGDSGDNILAGGLGNDTLQGKGGDDTYVFENDYGVDTITNETAGVDTIDFGAVTSDLDLDLSDTSVVAGTGNTVSWSSDVIENVIGGSGNDTLTGNDSDNSLTGGSGDDTYVVGIDEGVDTISDSGGTDTLDLSAFTDDIEVDLTTTAFGGGGTDTNQALLHFEGDDNSTTMTDEFSNTWTSYNGADIQSNTPWKTGEKHADLSGSQYIASTAVDTDGNAWTLRWRQRLNDVGSWRTLVAGNSNVALGVFVHNGYLKLHASSNNSSWDIGTDTGTTVISTNTWYEIEVTFSTTNGYTLYLDGTEEASLSSTTKMYDSNGLRFGMGYAGTDSSSGDVADVYFTNTEELHTSNFTPLSDPWSVDGVSWGSDELDNVIAGSGDDTLTGNASANVLTGGSGADSLVGAGGNDTYKFESGFGLDTISDSGGTDTLDFGAFTGAIDIDLSSDTSFVESAGNTVTWGSGEIEDMIGGSGADSLTGDTGANSIVAGAGDDILDGGTGNDTLKGGSGNDTYNLAEGDGTDSIEDTLGTSDKIVFGSTLDNTEVAFYMNGDNLEIGYDITSNTDLITVTDQDAGTGKQIDRFELDSGEFMTAADVAQVIQDMSAYATANSIDFNNLADVKANANLMQIITDGWNPAA